MNHNLEQRPASFSLQFQNTILLGYLCVCQLSSHNIYSDIVYKYDSHNLFYSTCFKDDLILGFDSFL